MKETNQDKMTTSVSRHLHDQLANVLHFDPSSHHTDESGKSRKSITVSYAPGRLNMIGEHIDYAGGKVLPAALDKGVFVVIERYRADRNNGKSGFVTIETKMREKVRFSSLDELRAAVVGETKKEKDWKVFALGCFELLCKNNDIVADSFTDDVHFTILSTLPIGIGVSSSAALSVALIQAFSFALGKHGFVLNKNGYPDNPISGLTQEARATGVRIALLAQQVERDYIGANVGIMDQTVSVFGRAGYFLELDCSHPERLQLVQHWHDSDKDKQKNNNANSTNEIETSAKLYLVDSMVKHTLGDAYNAIRRDIETGEAKLQELLKLPSFRLCDAKFCKPRQGEAFDPSREAVCSRLAAYCADVIAATSASATATAPSPQAIASTLSPDELLRACYVMDEVTRVERFVELLGKRRTRSDDSSTQIFSELGSLLNATHQGLSKQLRVSTPQLDFIQEQLQATHNHHHQQQQNQQQAAVFGARMMGGGFGGCVLVLAKHVSQSQVSSSSDDDDGGVLLLSELPKRFKEKFGVACDVYSVSDGDGAIVCELD